MVIDFAKSLPFLLNTQIPEVNFQEIVKRFNNGETIEELKKDYDILKDAHWDYLRGVDKGKAEASQWTEALEKSSGGVKKLASGLKLAAKNMGIMLAVTIAFKAAYAIFDHFNVTAEEQQEKVDGWASKVEELKSKYDELKGKNLSADEEKELEYLKNRLEYSEKQLETEQAILAMKELYGKGDIFSDGNLEPTTHSNGEVQVSYANEMSASADEMIKKFQKDREIADANTKWLETNGHDVSSGMYKEEAEQIDKLIAKREEMYEQRDKYYASLELLKEKRDSGVLSGEDKATVETDIEKYEKEIETLTNSIDKVTLYVDIVPVLAEDQINTKKALEEQFGKKNIGELSAEELKIAYKIENVGDMTFEQLKDAIKDVQDAAEEEFNITISTSDYIAELEKMSDGFSKIQSIYEDIQDAGDFDFGSLAKSSDLGAIFSEIDGYEDFVEVIANAPDDIVACQSAFDDLVSSWFYAQDPLKNITDETYDLTVTWLKQQGVENAVEMADYALAESKKAAYIASQQLTDGAPATIKAFMDEADMAGFTESQIIAMTVAMIQAENTTLDFSQQIAALQNLAVQAGLTAGALANLDAAKLKNDPQVQRAAAEKGISVEDHIVASYSNAILSASSAATYKPKANGWSKIISDNTGMTQEEIQALFENVDINDALSEFTEENSDATDENTRAILFVISALANLESELEAAEKKPSFDNFDDSIMDETDQAYH